jgi:tol-pal system protein YbgF
VTTSSTRASERGAAAALRFGAAVAFALLCASTTARAGLFDDEEARRRVDALRKELAQQGLDNEARIAKLEEQIHNIGVVEVLQQIEALKQEIAQLRGQLEVLSNENQQIQKRQRDFYLDLDSRLKRLEGGGVPGGAQPSPGGATAPPPDAGAPGANKPASGAMSPSAGMPPPAAGPIPPGGDGGATHTASRDDQAREVKAYDAASSLFRRNDFPSAVDAFRAFLKEYPQSQLAPNAAYWIGISYANMKDYRQALAAQEELLAKHPQSPKAPDALLAIASIQAEQGDSGSARNTLEDIIARYPASEAAGKARTRLASLRR